jgi:hypothetical protein
MASTVAIATRRRWPSESWCGARSVTPVIRTAAVHPVADRVAVEAEVEGAEGDVLGDGRHEELVVGVLEHEPDRRSQLAQVIADLQAGHLELPLPAQQPVEMEHQRRLAGAVRAEDGDALAVGHVQVEPVEPEHAVRIAVPQPAGVDGAAHAASSAITRTGTSTTTRALTNATSARPNASRASRGIVPP